LYRRLLAAIFPGKTVRAGLLYVEAPRLIEVEAAALDAAFGRLDAALRTP
jgi:ATP-dependent helicase/nuclease subunit A